MTYRISRKAEQDLSGIYQYSFLKFGEKQAEKYLLELESVFEIIGDYPYIGRVYTGKTRQFIHGKHIILYRIQENGVLIGRIIHGAQRKT